MGDDVRELKERLRQMRSENRVLSAENRKLAAVIEHTDQGLAEALGARRSDAADLEARAISVAAEIEREAAQRTQHRRERRREIMRAVRQQSEENKVLAARVRAI